MTVLKAVLAAALLVVSICSAADNVEVVPLETCNSCVTAGQSLHRTLVDAAGNPRAMMKLQEEICGFHPAAGQKLCGEVLQSGVPGLSRKLSSPVQVGLTLTLLSPAAILSILPAASSEQVAGIASQTCTDLGLCTKAEALSHLAQTGSNDINCPLCEYLMVMLKEQIADPATEEEIIAQANQVRRQTPCLLTAQSMHPTPRTDLAHVLFRSARTCQWTLNPLACSMLLNTVSLVSFRTLYLYAESLLTKSWACNP